MAIPRLNLVVLHAADVEQSRRFYEAIGPHFVREQHGRGPVHYACEMGETVLELYPRPAGSAPPSRPAPALGFCVPSIAVVLQRLNALSDPRAAEIEPSSDRPLRLVDPDGHAIFLTAQGDN